MWTKRTGVHVCISAAAAPRCRRPSSAGSRASLTGMGSLWGGRAGRATATAPRATAASSASSSAVSVGAWWRATSTRTIRALSGPDDLDALGAEDLVEGVAELGVASVEESERLLVAELRDVVACLLGRPVAVRNGGEGEYSIRRREGHEKEDADPLHQDGGDGENVAGGIPSSSSTLRTEVAETLTPRPFSSWVCAGIPVWVLAGEPQDQRSAPTASIGS
jgi:hypothetical protein